MLNKMETLKKYLIEENLITIEEAEEITVENCYNDNWEQFEVNGMAFKVLTDEEADVTTEMEILDSLWAFNADFILQHTEFYKNSSSSDDEKFIESLRKIQGELLESANSIVKALISDLDEFIQNAIDADGRGHFISMYDGEEHKIDGLYIYRVV